MDIFLAHKDFALQAKPRRHGRRRHPMLAGSCFGDDSFFAHFACEQDLADGVIDLVGAGVAEILALEINFRPAELLCESLGEIERRFSPCMLPKIMPEFLAE